jgi:hypothetical protein
LGILERSTSPGRPSVKTLPRSLAESGSNKWSSRGETAAVHRRPRTVSLAVSDAGHPWRKTKKEEEARTKARQRKWLEAARSLAPRTNLRIPWRARATRCGEHSFMSCNQAIAAVLKQKEMHRRLGETYGTQRREDVAR